MMAHPALPLLPGMAAAWSCDVPSGTGCLRIRVPLPATMVQGDWRPIFVQVVHKEWLDQWTGLRATICPARGRQG